LKRKNSVSRVERGQAVGQLLADAPPLHAALPVRRALQHGTGAAWIGQILLPPAIELRLAERQFVQGLGLRYSIGLGVAHPLGRIMRLARQLQPDQPQRHNEDQRHGGGEDHWQHHVMPAGAEPRHGAPVKRPKRHREHRRPGQGGEKMLQREQAQQHQAKRHGAEGRVLGARAPVRVWRHLVRHHDRRHSPAG
jgi:hypothetical protein